MYADQVVAGAKRSVKDRLDGDLDDAFGRRRATANGKRQRPNDDKWKHDLYEGDGPQISKSNVGVRDLRQKLNRKIHQNAYQGLKTSGVRDLREKLSGITQPQPSSNLPPKAKQVDTEVARTVKSNAQSADTPAVETKKVVNPAPRKKSHKKDEATVHSLLQSLDLEKYSITFQAEEVDMAALLHMNDDDLKALGIPMGPRKKILLALESKS